MKNELIEAAEAALKYSYSPYSHYRVGAAVKTTDGKIFDGCNIENASYSLTICAERVAIFKAVSEGKSITEIAVVVDDKHMPSPCGACRQVISELAPEAVLHLATKNGQYQHYTIKELLPMAFSLLDKDLPNE